MIITTTRFGEVEVHERELLFLPEGLLGFETMQRYCLLEHAPGSPFRWMQAVDDPALAFVVINPFEFFTDYDFDISDVDADLLNLDSVEDVQVFSLVTIHGTLVTTNLVGPLVVNRRHQIGKQIVLANPRYSTRHELVSPPVCVKPEYCEVA